jgi:two-component system LytT family response regulator
VPVSAEPLKVLIVDDEPYAREWLRQGLSSEENLEIVGEAGDGSAAVDAILRLKPDVVLLDVQMPGVDGFGVLDAIPDTDCPQVIFTTAFEQYAVRAFEAHAVDYLLKPIRPERLRESLERARKLAHQGDSDEMRNALRAVLSDVRREEAQSRWLLVKRDNHSLFLKLEDIDWVEASRNSVVLHAGKEKYTYREAISSVAARLDPASFFRIHRSTIVNVNRIRKIDPWFHGEYAVTLADGTRLMMSEPYRKRLKEFRRLA